MPYIVVYDAHKSPIAGYYWRAIKKLRDSGEVEHLQYSVFLCKNLDSAKKLVKILKRRDVSVRIFEVTREVSL